MGKTSLEKVSVMKSCVVYLLVGQPTNK